MAFSRDDFGTKDYHAPDPNTYIMDPPLEAALRVAIQLRLPLLITGEPGTGKTQFAYKVAQLFADMQGSDFLPKPIEFHTKTSSMARDLLYSYDAVRHFYDASRQVISADEDYITLTALGRAIVQSLPAEKRGRMAARGDGKPRNELHSASPRSSVVLIDEIDKAPRDFPNDLLHELDRFEFRIPEIRDEEVVFRRSVDQQIVVIITSNSEKNLPEAFLRRCAFYHIPSPSAQRMEEILTAHREKSDAPRYLDAEKFLISQFMALREKVSTKKPATAEMLHWVRSLETLLPHITMEDGFKKLNPAQLEFLRSRLGVLVKTGEDVAIAEEVLKMPPKAKV